MNSSKPIFGTPIAKKPVLGQDHGGIQVIARAAMILRALSDHPAGLPLGPLSRTVALPRSTVQRIVAALEVERLVESGGADGVKLGNGLSRLASTIQPNFADTIRPLLEELCRTLDETVVLGRRRKRDITIIDQVVAERELSFRSRPDGVFPLSCTAGGKALLAHMTDGAVAELLGPDLPRLTPTSPPDLPSLLAELSEIRRTGLAHDKETNGVGLCAIAISVKPCNESEAFHAVSVIVPTARFDAKRIQQIEEALLGLASSSS